MIKIAYKKNITQIYYNNLSNRKFQKENNKTLKELFDEKFKTEFDCTLEDLLYGSFEKLQEIKDRLGDMSKRDDVKELFNYETKFQKHISKFFEQYVEVHTCYFCNIEFINTFMTKDEKIKNGFTLDHYIDKGKYPYLALSLYNLIPSCYTCNSKVKRVRSVETLSPASTHFDFDNKVKFKTFMQNRNLLIDCEDDFALLLKEDFSDIYKQYIDVFELDGRYKYHKYKVIEMINRRKEYPDSRIKELALLTQKTEEEVKQDLFGEYLFEDDNLHKRPLSKLVRDISEELGLI